MRGYFQKSFLDKISEGYAYNRIILDENGVPCDYEFLEVNAAFEKQTGLKCSDIIGKKATEVLPWIQDYSFDWIKFCGDIALNGRDEKNKTIFHPLSRWYKVHVYSPEKYLFVTLYTDLSKDEEIFHRLNDNSQDIIFRYELSPVRGFTYVNNAAASIIGYTPEEYYDDPDMCLKIIHPDDRKLLGDCVQGKIPLHKPIVLRYIHKNGQTVWIEQRNLPTYDTNGNLIALEGIGRDITERKQAEDNIYNGYVRESAINEILRLSFKDLPIERLLEKALNLILDIPDFELENAGAVFLVEDDADCLVLKASHGLADPLLRKCARVPFGKCLCGRAASTEKMIFADRVDECHDIHYEGMKPHGHYCTPLRFKNQTIGVLNLYVQEGHTYSAKLEQFLVSSANALSGIIARKKAEEDINHYAGMITSLLDSIPDIIFFKDVKGVYMGCNPAFTEFVGRPREEIIGKTDYDLFDKAFADFFRKHDERTLELLQPRHNEEWITYPDGRKILLDMLKTPYRGPDGLLIGILGIGRDITERNRAEQALLKGKLIAEENDRMKSEFITNMSHELRTPLNSVIGFSDVLLKEIKGELNDSQKKYISNISKSGRHLLELINDILDLSKIEEGKMELQCEDFDLNSILSEVESIFSPQAAKKDINLQFVLSEKIPRIKGDKIKIKQVIFNLLTNAIKFTPKNGAISVIAKENDDNIIEVSVSDTGIGIPEAKLEDVFDPFIQVDASTSRNYGGTGVGLSLAKKFVQMHDGKFCVESEVYKGSTFTFTIVNQEYTSQSSYSKQ
ncbi:PAS domain S-box protein [Methanohalophilus mahii]|nr:PAS domain S-box protein [Methanohalophilus mahii]